MCHITQCGIHVPSYGRAERLQKKKLWHFRGTKGIRSPISRFQPSANRAYHDSPIPNWDPEEIWGCKVGYVIRITSYSHLITILNGLSNPYKPTNMTGLPKKLWDSTLPPIDPNRSANWFPKPYALPCEVFKIPSLVAEMSQSLRALGSPAKDVHKAADVCCFLAFYSSWKYVKPRIWNIDEIIEIMLKIVKILRIDEMLKHYTRSLVAAEKHRMC